MLELTEKCHCKPERSIDVILLLISNNDSRYIKFSCPQATDLFKKIENNQYYLQERWSEASVILIFKASNI